MKLYAYVVARDFGFAPNPFFGVCTLATCKPKIRKSATTGDWVIGTGSRVYGLDGRLVYAMLVADVISFDQFWAEPRFLQKRPNLSGSRKQAFGDNIYHRNPETGRWMQVNSHHSHSDGRPNAANIKHDTQTDRVLISTEFVYWGGSGPTIPVQFRRNRQSDICAHRGHKCNFRAEYASSFIQWIKSRKEWGYAGAPAEFRR